MQSHFVQIKNSPIFCGMNKEELVKLLECFKAKIKTYSKGDLIIRQGDNITKLYLILNGNVNIEKDTFWANRIIISKKRL